MSGKDSYSVFIHHEPYLYTVVISRTIFNSSIVGGYWDLEYERTNTLTLWGARRWADRKIRRLTKHCKEVTVQYRLPG